MGKKGAEVGGPGWHSPKRRQCHPEFESTNYFFFADFFAGFLDLAAGFFFSGTDSHLRSKFGVCCSHFILNSSGHGDQLFNFLFDQWIFDA